MDLKTLPLAVPVAFRYLLILVDYLSGFAWARPLISKTAEEVAAALTSFMYFAGTRDSRTSRIPTDGARKKTPAPLLRTGP